MNRASFLKRLLASLFGAAIINPSLRAKRSNPADRSANYLLSATVAGTPYYDYPEVGPRLLPPVISSDSRNENLIEKSSLEHPAILKLEPDNPYDHRAIAVYWQQSAEALEVHKLGYIPRKDNKVLYNLLKDGHQLKAFIRLRYLHHPEDLINIADIMDAYDLRIRVYLLGSKSLQI